MMILLSKNKCFRYILLVIMLHFNFKLSFGRALACAFYIAPFPIFTNYSSMYFKHLFHNYMLSNLHPTVHMKARVSAITRSSRILCLHILTHRWKPEFTQLLFPGFFFLEYSCTVCSHESPS